MSSICHLGSNVFEVGRWSFLSCSVWWCAGLFSRICGYVMVELRHSGEGDGMLVASEHGFIDLPHSAAVQGRPSNAMWIFCLCSGRSYARRCFSASVTTFFWQVASSYRSYAPLTLIDETEDIRVMETIKRISSSATDDGKKYPDVGNSSQQSSSCKASSPPQSILVFGYLNLFSDGVHNFTDGMALGSAFSLHGSVGGWSRTLFLLARELLQEVGDFVILVRSGFSVPKALFLNFLSATVALAGTALGFTAVGFIYITFAYSLR